MRRPHRRSLGTFGYQRLDLLGLGFSFSWMPFHGAGFQGSHKLKKQSEKEPCVTPFPTHARRHQQYYFIVLFPPFSLTLSRFSFLVSHAPANAMRQLFQTTISLCGQGCGSTHLFLCFFLFVFFFFYHLLLSPLGPPSLGLSSWTPAISCVTQPRYMRPCVRECMRAYVHGAHDNGIFAFPILLPFSLPCPSPFCISSRLPFPGS